MNRVVKSYLLSIVVTILVCWVSVSILEVVQQIVKTKMWERKNWYISMNLTPFVVLLVVALIMGTDLLRRRKKIGGSALFMYPTFFPEQDEREKMITAAACRNAYMTTSVALPIGVIVAAFLPFLPVASFVYLLGILYVIVLTSFHFTLYRHRLA